MSKIYYGDRAPGGSLKHYRTKGSRNGYSKNPNYKVVGQRAKGKWVNGRYVYDQPTNKPMYSKTSSQSRGFLSQYSQGAHQRTSDPIRDKINEKAAATKVKLAAARGSQNNWQQQAARAQAGLQSNMQGPRTTPSGMGNDPRYTQQVQTQSKPGAASRVKQKARVAKAAAKGAKNDWQQQAIKAAAQGNLTGKIARGEVGAAKANNGDVYSARELGYQGSSKSKKSRAAEQGAKNNWQQQGNATAGMTNAYNNLKDNKIRTIDVTGQLGIMQNLDRQRKRSQSKSAKREKAAKRAALINKIKDKISSFFKKKK